MNGRAMVLALLGAACITGLAAGPADAATGSAFSFSFNAPGGFGNASAAAVDQTDGDVYISDFASQLVWKFNVNLAGRTAEPVAAFGGKGEGNVPVANLPFQPTVDSYPGGEGDLLVPELEGEKVIKFSATGTPIALTNPIEGVSQPSGVGVDNKGDIYVARLGGAVLKYNAAGKPVNAAGVESSENTVATASSQVRAMAVDSTGEHIYLASESGVLQYALSAGEYVQGVTLHEGSRTDGVAIVPAGSPAAGDVFVESPGEIFQYEPSGTLLTSFGGGVLGGGGAVARLAAYGTATGAVVYAPNEGSGVEVFETFSEPAIVTGEASEVTHTTATVNGTVNPEGLAVTGCHFEYGEEHKTQPCETPASEITGKNEVIPVSAKLGGLEPGTRYAYKLVIESEGHSPNGGEQELTTPPVGTVTTEAATEVLAETATLNGIVSSLVSGETEYYFEYGTEEHYEHRTAPVTFTGEQTVSPVIPVSGLAPASEYQARLVAVIEGHSITGSPVAFKTLSARPTVLPGSVLTTTRTTATIVGEVNPEGDETAYYVEYGEFEPRGAHGSPSAVGHIESEPAGPRKIVQTLEELKAGRTYHYRILASNQNGVTLGPEGTFKTTAPQPAGAETGEAREVTPSSATITATVNPNGLQTGCIFEVGTENEGTIAYSPTYCHAGGGSEPVGLTLALSNLLPGTTYHYRIAAVNEEGVVYGADRTLTTPGFPTGIGATPPAVALLPFTLPKETKEAASSSKQLTRAQKLTKALKACRKDKSKSRRAACTRHARKLYGPPAKKKRK